MQPGPPLPCWAWFVWGTEDLEVLPRWAPDLLLREGWVWVLVKIVVGVRVVGAVVAPDYRAEWNCIPGEAAWGNSDPFAAVEIVTGWCRSNSPCVEFSPFATTHGPGWQSSMGGGIINSHAGPNPSPAQGDSGWDVSYHPLCG